MTENEFDERLGRAAESLVSLRISRDVAQLELNRGSRLQTGPLFVGAILLLAVVLIGPRLQKPVAGAAAVTAAGTIQVAVEGDLIHVSVAVPGQDEAELSISGVESFAVRQLICSRLGRSEVVFVGRVPTKVGTRLRFEGLGDGRLTSGQNGAFIFVTDGPIKPGLVWSARYGDLTVSGQVPGQGSRLDAGASPAPTVACFVYDPAVESNK